MMKMYNEGLSAANIAKRLAISRSTVYSNLNRLKQTGTMDDRPRSGRPETASSSEVVKRIREKICRQPRRSMRELARVEGISEGSIRRIVKIKLGMRAYKIRKAQLLRDSTKAERLRKCKTLLKRFDAARHRNILFTDESVFTIEQFVNHQNDRILARNVEKASSSGNVVERSGYPQFVMVFAGITANGKTPLIFVEKRIKIDSRNYLEDILEKEILPWASQHFKDTRWTFQQDSAPAHKAKVVQRWCADNFLDLSKGVAIA